MSKHTPGPWHVRSDDAEKVACHNGIGLAVMSGMHRDSVEREANARLIAAAPDLLEALQECVTENGAYCLRTNTVESLRTRLDAITEIARAAIAKATGE